MKKEIRWDVSAMRTIEEKLHVLTKIADKFNRDGIRWAVGASLLLYLKGYVDTFNDIDLLIDENDAFRAKERMMELGEMEPPRPNQYKAAHFYIFDVDGVEVDIMGSYIVNKDGEDFVIELPKDAQIEWITIEDQRIPLDSIPMWRRHYDVMGRQWKVDLIDRKKKEEEK